MSELSGDVERDLTHGGVESIMSVAPAPRGDERADEPVTSTPGSFRRAGRRLVRNPVAMAALAFITLMVVEAEPKVSIHWREIPGKAVAATAGRHLGENERQRPDAQQLIGRVEEARSAASRPWPKSSVIGVRQPTKCTCPVELPLDTGQLLVRRAVQRWCDLAVVDLEERHEQPAPMKLLKFSQLQTDSSGRGFGDELRFAQQPSLTECERLAREIQRRWGELSSDDPRTAIGALRI